LTTAERQKYRAEFFYLDCAFILRFDDAADSIMFQDALPGTIGLFFPDNHSLFSWVTAFHREWVKEIRSVPVE